MNLHTSSFHNQGHMILEYEHRKLISCYQMTEILSHQSKPSCSRDLCTVKKLCGTSESLQLGSETSAVSEKLVPSYQLSLKFFSLTSKAAPYKPLTAKVDLLHQILTYFSFAMFTSMVCIRPDRNLFDFSKFAFPCFLLVLAHLFPLCPETKQENIITIVRIKFSSFSKTASLGTCKNSSEISLGINPHQFRYGVYNNTVTA